MRGRVANLEPLVLGIRVESDRVKTTSHINTALNPVSTVFPEFVVSAIV
jgi:hypothetical protein